MNIKDLAQGSYTVTPPANQDNTPGKLNINNLPAGSYQEESQQQPQKKGLFGKINDFLQGYGNAVGNQQLQGIDKIISSGKTGGNEIVKSASDTNIGESAKDAAKGAIKTTAGVITGVAQAALAPITPIVSKITKALTPAFRATNPQLAAAYDAIMPKVSDVASKHPEAAGDLSDLLNTALLAIGGEIDLGNVASQTKESLTQLPGNVKSTTSDLFSGTPKSDSEIIQSKISPKLTPKETRIAQSEGRIVKGKDPTLFKSGTPDTVTPSKADIQSSKVIESKIPGAAKMDNPTLYTSVKNKISEIAKNLEPAMKATKADSQAIIDATNKWETLKNDEIENSLKTEEPNVVKRQNNFEKNFLARPTKTLDDIWKTAQEYDDSISSAVKKANEQSSDALQQQKSEWLKRRSIFKDIINDSKYGLGKTSTQAFSDMTDLYHAKSNLDTTAEVDTEIKPSKVRKAYDSKTGKWIRGTIGSGVVVEGARRIITGNF